MEKSLHDLIEAATISGHITDEQRKFIVDRAKELGVDEAEVNIYIDAALQKNKANSSSHVGFSGPGTAADASAPSGEWLKRKDFTVANWVMLAGGILTLIAGFFPWVTSSVSSSGFGSSYSSGASVGGGFFYTFPMGIAALVFALKHKFTKYRLYYGLIIIVAAIGFIASYDSRSSAGFGGISASASTSAGPGVALLLLAGVIYTVGALIARFGNNDKVKEHAIKALKIAGVLALVNLCYSGLSIWSVRNSQSMDLDDLYYPILSLVAVIALPRIKQTAFIRLPLTLLYVVVIADVFLRTLSFFPTNDVSQIIQDKVGEDAYELEIPDEVYKLSVSNDNWFSSYGYEKEFGLLAWVSDLASDAITSIAWFLTIPGYVIVLMFAFTLYPLSAFQERVKGAGEKIEEVLGDRWKSKGSVTNWLMHWGTWIIMILVTVKLSTAFAFNSIRHAQIISALSDVTDQYEEKKEAEQDSIDAATQKAEALKAQVGQLNTSLSGLYASPTEILDSTFVVVVESFKESDLCSQRVQELKDLGLPADSKAGPYNASLSYSPQFLIIGTYSNVQSCKSATLVLKGFFPQAVGYYLAGYGEMMALDKLEAQKALQDSINQSQGM